MVNKIVKDLEAYLQSKTDIGLISGVKAFDRSGGRLSWKSLHTSPAIVYLCGTTEKIWEEILRWEVNRYAVIMKTLIVKDNPIFIGDKYPYGKEYIVLTLDFRKPDDN